ncbi:hypothetical protein PF002_g38 [Phytophthora fragariae]|uniref:Uncharacterized protein n=1 Tax=Phytophthora fragariae TaxID=53985 RepID=A0A6A4EQ15_9STRA|nr:hypothetical protein PF009_g346 [Phytophthora fragariae]KAE9155487.1 hypothetical protein PF006_g574 [Phytophthora fragariae]KAE9258525.1 hypothetical protein PF002_g38 [Phytophthora fragariae]KAE9329928.1 hypothetical protein PF001_g663 [Phytophthora fragariae]
MVNDAAEDYYQRRTRLRIQSDRSWSKLATISVTRLASTYFFFFWKTVLMPQDTRRQLTIESTFAVEDDGAQRLSSRYQQGRIRDERSVLQAFAEYDDVDQNISPVLFVGRYSVLLLQKTCWGTAEKAARIEQVKRNVFKGTVLRGQGAGINVSKRGPT